MGRSRFRPLADVVGGSLLYIFLFKYSQDREIEKNTTFDRKIEGEISSDGMEINFINVSLVNIFMIDSG